MDLIKINSLVSSILHGSDTFLESEALELASLLPFNKKEPRISVGLNIKVHEKHQISGDTGNDNVSIEDDGVSDYHYSTSNSKNISAGNYEVSKFANKKYISIISNELDQAISYKLQLNANESWSLLKAVYTEKSFLCFSYSWREYHNVKVSTKS